MTDALEPMMPARDLGPRAASRYRSLEGRGSGLPHSFSESENLPAITTLWLVSVIVFVSTHLPGINVARRVLGREATRAQLQDFSRAPSLDEPIYSRYGQWPWDLVRGNWGCPPPATGRSAIVLPRFVYT